MEGKSLTKELWRKYTFHDHYGIPVEYKIDNPKTLFIGDTTHRVVDSTGLVHCVPAVGHFGCTLVWMPKDLGDPVQF